MARVRTKQASAPYERRAWERAMKLPLLTAEREVDLARRWRRQDDVAAMHELVSAYIRLVLAMASRYRGFGLPFADLIQEGNVGLLAAAARFDPERNVRFSTYASWWIRAAIQEYVLRNWSIVRGGTSATQKALFFNLRWLRAKLENPGERESAGSLHRRIAAAIRVAPKEVEAAASRLAVHDQSLNQPIGIDGSDEWQDFIADERPSPEDSAMERHDHAVRVGWLNAALDELTPREQHIVRERMLRDEHITLEELGGRLGITKERVRQIEHKALAKLKQSVLRRGRDKASQLVGAA